MKRINAAAFVAKRAELGSGTKAIQALQPGIKKEAAAVKSSRMLKTDKVMALLESRKEKYLNNLDELADNATNEGVRASVNQDLLNRAGVTKDAANESSPVNNEALMKAIEKGDEIQLLRILRAK